MHGHPSFLPILHLTYGVLWSPSSVGAHGALEGISQRALSLHLGGCIWPATDDPLHLWLTIPLWDPKPDLQPTTVWLFQATWMLVNCHRELIIAQLSHR